MIAQGASGMQMVDMHCHPSFLADPAAFAQAAQHAGLGMFATTVTPEDYDRARLQLGSASNVRLGVGLHPWWVSRMEGEGEALAAAEAAAERARDTRYVGEVGLDFGKRWEHARDWQLAAFARIARACAAQGEKIVSLHAVRSAAAVLDVLEDTGCLKACDVVFHWYSDSGQALSRAIRSGCFFSVNTHMLATKRGREYARAIPASQLLVETDLPPDDEPGFGLDAWLADIRACLEELAALRGKKISEKVLANSLRLLNWE